MNAPAPSPPRIWRPRARILVVDDLNHTRHVISSLLKNEGYDAEVAPTVSIALLQPVKGTVVGLQWALYMHGFGDAEDAIETHPEL